MRSADNPIFWRVSKANAARMARWFVVIGVAVAVVGAAPDWSVVYFALALPCGLWWFHRWYGDVQRAQQHHTVLNLPQAPQTQLAPAKTTPGNVRGLFLLDTPDNAETPSRPDVRS